jgi:hypothetical protein
MEIVKEVAVKNVFALLNDLQSQAPNNLDDEFSQFSRTKTAMVCKLAQITLDIWMSLPLEAKMWLLNERKRQQIEYEKAKKAGTICDKSSVKFFEKIQKMLTCPTSM